MVNVAVHYVLPAVAIGQSASPMSDAVTRSALGPAAALIASAAIVVSLVTSLNGVAMSGARMAFAVARDGNFFSTLAKVHPRFHTPHTATIFQAALSVICLLVGGSFRQLFTLALFSEWLSYVAASVALFVFRARGNTGETGTKAWQFPVAPALFIVASAGLLYYTFTSNLRYSVVGTLIISAGIPMYYAFARRRV
jgi:APA family basic amino acid/polyamine antiporter